MLAADPGMAITCKGKPLPALPVLALWCYLSIAKGQGTSLAVLSPGHGDEPCLQSPIESTRGAGTRGQEDLDRQEGLVGCWGQGAEATSF